MELEYGFNLMDKVISPVSGEMKGVITELGYNKFNNPVYYIEFATKDIPDEWISDKVTKDLNYKVRYPSIKVNFKYKAFDRVDSPLSDGIITWAGYNADGEISYVVTNKVQGVANSWWPENVLKSVETK